MIRCWCCGGAVENDADETGDTCDACIDEEVAVSRDDRRRARLGDLAYEEEEGR